VEKMLSNLFGSKKPISYGDTLLIKTMNGKYLKVGQLGTVNVKDIGLPFRIEGYFGKTGNVGYSHYVFLLTHNEKFLTADEDGTIRADSLTAQQWELFKLVSPEDKGNQLLEYGSQVAFQTAHDKYLSVTDNLTAHTNTVGPHEIFTFEKSSEVIQYDIRKKKPSLTLCYNDVFKLQHVQTKCVLHSHLFNYKTGSQCQQVTAYHKRDENDWFQVLPIGGETGPISFNSVVRIKHLNSGKFLYSSAGFQSPASNQQEVCCKDANDGNERWRIIGMPNGKIEACNVIQLVHVNTGFKLHSHNISFYFGMGFEQQQEVTCYGLYDNNDDWTIIEIRGKCYME
jgi:hypothetical protein